MVSGTSQSRGIQIKKENNASISVKEYLMEELNKMEDGSAEYFDIDQLDECLEATIRKYET